MGLVSLFPHFFLSLVGTDLYSKCPFIAIDGLGENDLKEAEVYKFPLTTFQNSRWEPYLTLQDFESIKACDSYVFGTSTPGARLLVSFSR